ncbi:hypothetical protein N3114_11155 [Aliarcobacter butzleri]|uniref:hypothetical protein n=1 Tax=Aliarcobacter butzleri TaxID=28197 RepID=UPI0021B334A5|nr:hypothetical protein [Aliarcobacter butzleri]UXC28600.1 hypothetical protein N3114_07915 [Aliarcobacter butzleri]UXC29197.1 hypothetical protein N3114_11155 [Aliarcobacter butzleri]
MSLSTEKPIPFNTEMVKAILDGIKTQTRRPIKIKNKLTRDWAETSGVDWIKVNLEDEKYPYSIREQNGAWNEYSLDDFIKKYSKYKVGDVLWVREPVKVTKACNDTSKIEFEYLSDGTKKIIDIPNKYLDEYDFIKNNCFLAKLNQLHYDKEYIGVPNGCLKEMARIFIKVTNVRVERLQDISDEDCIKEGIVEVTKDNQVFKFCIYDKKDYSSTPWQDMPRNPQEVYKKLWNSIAKDGYKWEDNPYVFVYEFERLTND